MSRTAGIASQFVLNRNTIQHGALRAFQPAAQIMTVLLSLSLPYHDPLGQSCSFRLNELQQLSVRNGHILNTTRLAIQTLTNPLSLYQTTQMSSQEIANLYYHTLKCGIPGNFRMMPEALNDFERQFNYQCYNGTYKGNVLLQPQCLCDAAVHTTDYPANFCRTADCPYGQTAPVGSTDCARCPAGSIKPTSGTYRCLTAGDINQAYMYLYCREWPALC